MNQFNPAKSRHVNQANILTIGVAPENISASLFSKPKNPFSWNHLHSVEEMALWLRADRVSVPLMVFADYRTVRENNFWCIRNFRGKKALQYVPVILLNCPKGLDFRKALVAGIDDWYQEPEDWGTMIARGRQLQRVRSKLGRPQPETERQSVSNFWKWGKRAFDIVAASSMLLLCAPVCLLIAALIKLESKGPVIYRSKRAGQNYRIFDFLKFRSMYVDADQRLEELKALNQYGDESAFVKIKNDPRITRVGRIIRKTSLDELPQLFNVLKGDMSLVGNRPLPLYEAEQLCNDITAERFAAPAGITGLWQVTKRGKDDMSVEERISLDIEYSRKSSFLFDLKIVFKTLPAMLQHENV